MFLYCRHLATSFPEARKQSKDESLNVTDNNNTKIIYLELYIYTTFSSIIPQNEHTLHTPKKSYQQDKLILGDISHTCDGPQHTLQQPLTFLLFDTLVYDALQQECFWLLKEQAIKPCYSMGHTLRQESKSLSLKELSLSTRNCH